MADKDPTLEERFSGYIVKIDTLAISLFIDGPCYDLCRNTRVPGGLMFSRPNAAARIVNRSNYNVLDPDREQ